MQGANGNSDAGRSPQAPLGCIICGPDNPRGLQLGYELTADGSATARWTPAPDWQGFDGIIHGGIISAVLDEAMAKAVNAAGCRALTAELRVRFRHQVAPGEELSVRGWIADCTKRLVKAEAAIVAADGSERAHAWSVFLPLPVRPDTLPPSG